jgi:hypothetical protein
MSQSSSYSDSWVVDRTFFDHAALGQCQCCGGGVAMMAQSPLELCTDLDTDDRRQDALAPFPACMRAEIDKSRLSTRLRLKETLPKYQALVSAPQFLELLGGWWTTLTLARKHRQVRDLLLFRG